MAKRDLTFEEFYSQYRGIVYGYLFKRLSSASDAEDLTADVFLACYKAFGGYDPERASISTWLFVIVNNRLKNFYRDRKPQVDADNVAEEAWGVQGDSIMLRSMALHETRKQVAEALKHLPERERQVVVCKYFNEMTAAQIADQMGLTESNVRTILHRSLKELQRYVR